MSSNKRDNPSADTSLWPRAMAITLCVLTFPLLFVGALVTSTDAGMAVPDWPSTYGYNMFAYPWQTWFFGPWDLFIEHGHRLLASLVGLVTIILVQVTWISDRRRWLLYLAFAALGLVILQGVLGGVRVIESDRLIAMIHGCIGPLFFALTAVLVGVTSQTWRAGGAANRRTAVPRGAVGLLLATALLAFVQLTLGAQLRHAPEGASPWAFAAIVKLHLLVAGFVAVHALAASGRVLRAGADCPPVLRRLAAVIAGVVVVQLGLGFWTWLLKYGAPGWAAGWLPATIEVNVADSWLQTHIVTSHSAVGSLLLGLAALATTLAWRHAASQSSLPSHSVSAESHAQ